MKERILYLIWLCLYIICVGMGTITQRGTVLTILLAILSLVFFIPAIVLLYNGITGDHKKMLLRVRIVSLCSLLLTLSMVVLNIVTVNAGDQVGLVMNDLLYLCSAPMFCAYPRALSIFLWACVFVSSFPRMWKKS